MLGWKYNMDNIQAAILLPQLDRLEATWEKRERLAQTYRRLLADVDGLVLPADVPGGRHARHLFPVWVRHGRRDQVVAMLQQQGISVVVNYRAMHLLSYFREQFGSSPGMFPVAEGIGDSAVSLPFYPNMPVEYAEQVACHLRKFLAQGERRAA
jgi:UDP-4-amino-4-deoxy-L-arabinose-oxoglutarate aminotransferase